MELLAHPMALADSWQTQIQQQFPDYVGKTTLLVDVSKQRLQHFAADGQFVKEYVVSTATKGVGSQKGSEKTPLGFHRVRYRYGDGAPLGMIFRGRIATGEIAPILTERVRSKADNVTTRILWLDGLEIGRNKDGDVDSFTRYIYIHGTDEEGYIGEPASHGCIRMRNNDVIELFEQVKANSLVVIHE